MQFNIFFSINAIILDKECNSKLKTKFIFEKKIVNEEKFFELQANKWHNHKPFSNVNKFTKHDLIDNF